jgi:hypothetical protein
VGRSTHQNEEGSLPHSERRLFRRQSSAFAPTALNMTEDEGLEREGFEREGLEKHQDSFRFRN